MSASRQSLVDHAEELANEIRTFGPEKLDDWKRVPYWALQALGVDNIWSGQQYAAFKNRVWKLYEGDTSQGQIGFSVKLKTGEIQRYSRYPTDDELLCLVPCLDKIDGSKVLAELKEIAHVVGCKCNVCEGPVPHRLAGRDLGSCTFAQFRQREAKRLKLQP